MSKRSFRESPAAIMGFTFVVALLVRLVYLWAFHGSPYFSVPIVDAQWHDLWAWGWAKGTWSMDGRAFFRAPLYPFWLSLIYRVFGHELVAARIVQAVIGAGTAAALAGCGWRLRGKRVALWSGAIASFYGPFVFFDAELLIPNLLVALLSWSLFLLLAPRSSRAHAAAFFLLGLAVIARPNALVLLPVFAWYVWSGMPRDARHRKRLLGGMVAAGLVPALLVTALNARAERTFVFIASQGGVNFYSGNNPNATGRTLAVDELKEAQGSWADFVQASHEVAENASGRRLSSSEVSRYWSEKAWTWIRSSPAEAARLAIKKTAFLFNSYELPNERDLYFERPFPLNVLLWTAGWFSFPWGIVFPLAAAGAVIGLRRPKTRRVSVVLAGWVVLYGLSFVPYFICARFRTGMVPPMIVLAGFALGGARELIGRAPLAGGIAAFLVTNNNLFGVRISDPTQELARKGVTLVAAGRLDEGSEALRAAIERAKGKAQPPSYLGDFACHLGDAYARRGNREEALRYFRESLTLGCTTLRLLTGMGRSLAEMGYPVDAAAAFEKALELHPKDGALWADLGAVYDKTGKGVQAEAAYRRAIDLAPQSSRGYNSLGLMYSNRSEADSAVAVWRRGVEHVPENFALRFNLALALAQEGEHQSALREIERCLEIAPADSSALSLREEIMNEMKRR